MRFVDFFAGIGGIRLGLEQAGHECVGFCEWDKYARTAYKAMYDTEGEWENHDVRTVRPCEVPKADLWSFGFPCFPAGTLIKADKGLIPIENLKVGDNVLTHKKRYMPIVQTMNSVTKETYHISAYGTENLVTTAEHPFYVTKKSKIWDSEKRSYGRHFADFEWVKAKDLTSDHYLTIPIEQEEKPINWDGIEYSRHGTVYKLCNLPLENDEFYWFIGRWLGDGWTTETTRNDSNKPRQKVVLCCSHEETVDVLGHIAKTGLRYTTSREKTTTKFIFSNNELFAFLRRYGHGAENKFVHQELLQLPKRLLKLVLDGYFSADGCIVDGRYKATTISRKLAYSIAACINKVYHRGCAIYHTERAKTHKIESRTVNQQDTYQIVFTKENHKQDKAFYKDGYICVPIRNIEVNHEQCTVYNIGVREDESYTANAICVHNCQDISVAGKQKGLQEGERSGLFYEIMRLLAGRRQEDRPQWLLVENVKNLLSIGNGFDFARLLLEVGGYGYSLQWQVLNSKDFGVPQNRERVFVVGYLGDIRGREVFPLERTNGENPCKLKEITGGLSMADRIYSTDGISRTLATVGGGGGARTGLHAIRFRYPERGEGSREKGYMEQIDCASALTSKHCGDQTSDCSNGVVCMSIKQQKLQRVINAAPTLDSSCRNNLMQNQVTCAVLTPDRAEKRQNGRRIKEPGEPSFTLTAQDRHGVAIYQRPRGYNKGGMHDAAPALSISAWQENNLLADGIRIRRLTPRECWRLQGFPEEYFDKAKAAGISDTQLYKQAGNGVTVNVARAIGERLKEIEENG